jgi:hypothetical protein
MHAQPLLCLQVEVPVEHGLLMENLLDLAHAPFTHTGTFAKGWPVPDAVRFHAQRLLSGNWDPYPIDMSFEPPCMVVSMIGLKQAGQIEAGARAEECKNHLHQLHVCLPSRRGHTRLLYRMSLDFMPWIRWVPGISFFWNYIAGQVRPFAVCWFAPVAAVFFCHLPSDSVQDAARVPPIARYMSRYACHLRGYRKFEVLLLAWGRPACPWLAGMCCNSTEAFTCFLTVRSAAPAEKPPPWLLSLCMRRGHVGPQE